MALWVFVLVFLAGLAAFQGVYSVVLSRQGGVALQVALENLRGGAVVERRPAARQRPRGLQAIIERAVDRLRPYGSRVAPDDTAQRLVWAGLRMDVDRFGAIRLLSTAAGGLCGLVLLGPALGSLGAALFMAAVGAAAGWVCPDAWLSSRVRARHRDIDRELPTWVDALANTVAADVPLEVALNRVQEEMPGIVSSIFAVANRSRLAGQTLEDGLEWAAEQLGHPDLKQVVNQIIRSRETGTPLSQGLREIARVLRAQRRERAREMSARMGVAMIFPLVLFILPVTMLYLVFPAIVTLMRGLFAAS